MSAEAADLTGLVERLRSAGFRVDTRQFLTAHELLLAYARRGKPLLGDSAALASHLGPVFCTQAEEQARFAEEVAAWQGVFDPAAAGEPRETAPFAFWRRWRRPLFGAEIIAALLLALVVGSGGLIYYEYHEVVLTGQVLVDARPRTPAPGAIVRFRDQVVPLDAEARFRLSTTRARGFDPLTAQLAGHAPANASVSADSPALLPPLVLRPLPAAPEPGALTFGAARVITLGAPAPYARNGGPPWKTIVQQSGVAALLAFMLVGMTGLARRWLAKKRLEAAAGESRTPALQRLAHHGDVDEVTLTPPPRSAIAMSDFALRRVASTWRRPREQPIFELDAAATVDTTLRAGGLFAPVYAARRAMPEYVALVHRRSEDDHWARFALEWLARLSASGVNVDVFTFHDDPRTCYDADKARRPHRLASLLAQHHRATALLFAESRVCFAPGAPALESWVHALAALPRRVLFTPEAPYRFGFRESALAAQGFVVLPGSADGLRLFGELAADWRLERLFPAPYARAFPRMLADEPERWLASSVPPKEDIERLVAQLRGYLGPDGFGWLCGCAVYPQIAWPLTLYLAGAVDPARRAATPLLDVLPALGRLPWLRDGFMPDWLRRALIAQMSKAQEATIRIAIEALLEEVALSATKTDAAGSRAGTLSISRWIGPADMLAAAPPGSPLAERVFLGFMSSTNVDPLRTSVKESLLQLFRAEVGAFDEPAPAVSIFVSYRRSDSAPYAGRLVDRLRQSQPQAQLIDGVDPPFGVPWEQALDEAVHRADVVLVIIGPKWLQRDEHRSGAA